MPLLSASSLGKSFGPVDIFSGVSFGIPHRGRIALIGPNGVGKTTLLRILVGLEEPSEGTVQRARRLTTGYLPQEAELSSASTLWASCLEEFAGLVETQASLHQMEAQMALAGGDDGSLETYGKLQHQFDVQGGYTFEFSIRQTLTGLGFTTEDFNRPVDQLSGGQRTRAYLAKLLLSNPDLLLMDEPTNHLDIAAVEWLEKYLKDWEGAALIVSHDRYFLDQVAEAMWEMTPGAFELYRGNYSNYLTQRSIRYAQRLEEYQAQAAFIEKEEEYIRRNIAGQNTRQAQGRRKRLERLLEEARLSPPPGEQRRMHINLQPISRSGDLVVRTYGLSVGYADEGRPLFSVPDLVLRRGECAAIIGPNGAGKTTFLKTLLEQVAPYAGEAELGSSLQIGYFAQTHDDLNPGNDLIEEIQSVAAEMREGNVRDYLAKFLFTGEDVFKKVEVLSGGERSRLALAKLSLSGANLLLLDEPTNHLDLPSQEVLQGILAHFPGTILLVSHDRYLIDALASQVWEIDPDEASLRVFEGTYSEYRASSETQAALQPPLPPKPAPLQRPKRPEPAAKPKPERAGGTAYKRKRLLEDLETRIAGVEWELAGVSRQLEQPPADPALVQRLGSDYVRLEAELNNMLSEWDKLASRQ